MKKKVLVGLSGGVDSSFAAYQLKRRGYQVIAVYIRIYPDWLERFYQRRGATCPWALDQRDARSVAQQLNIPFYVFDFSTDYQHHILANFVAEYRQGRTPNPDVLCNRFIKFGRFLEVANQIKADYVATGHYVIKKGKKLFRGRDPKKDQSYFLWMLNQRQIKRSLFPIGEYTKNEVRSQAEKVGLRTASKPDSQGICFLGQIQVADFLKEKIKPRAGEIVTTQGETIGQHDGVWFFTLGQRLHRARLNFRKTSFQGKNIPSFYVVDKDLQQNRLIVGLGDDPQLFSSDAELEQINWISGQAPAPGEPLSCQVRYRQPAQRCSFRFIRSQQRVRVFFKSPQRAVTAGQSLVFYRGRELLGGGIIQSIRRAG